jgi:protein-tyrosine-phosphatase
VRSAGLVSPGQSVPDVVAGVLAERGLDVTGHRSQLLTADLVDTSDLVVGMTREHVRAAVILRPDAFARSFTLRELARRAAELGDRAAGVALATWLDQAHSGRSAAEYMRDDPDDDIADPHLAPVRVFRTLADQIDDLTGRVVTSVLAASPS